MAKHHIFLISGFLLFGSAGCGAKLAPSPIFPSFTTDIEKEVQQRNTAKPPASASPESHQDEQHSPMAPK